MPYKDTIAGKIKKQEYYRLSRLRMGKKPRPPKRSEEERKAAEKARKRVYPTSSNYLKRYGITLEQYEQKLAAQGGVCAICKGVSKQRLAVDHNHETNEVRELLCSNCNIGLGQFKDRTDLMYAAISYVEKWQR